MDEMRFLAEMREDVPDTRYPAALRALMAEVTGAAPAPARRLPRRPVLVGGALAGAVAAGAIAVAVTPGGEPHAPPRRTPVTSPAPLATVTSPMTLAANAVVLARRAPVPAPTAWIYEKKESTTSNAPPSGAMAQTRGSHRTTEAWTRVDRLYVATVQHGRTRVTSTNGGLGTPIGWPAITYGYLNSLPSDPGALLALMRRDIAGDSYNGKATDNWVFDSVIALMENYTALPPRLNAALYGVLARLKVVHLDHVTDIAGRHVLGLYRISEGEKESILIDPATYAYAGRRVVMVADHTLHALDGTRVLRKGVLLADEAILVSRIVNAPGARS